jgi:hypothetical protein
MFTYYLDELRVKRVNETEELHESFPAVLRVQSFKYRPQH